MYPNPMGIPNQPYYGAFSALNTAGGLLFYWQTCKEEFLTRFAGNAIMRGDINLGVAPTRDGSFDCDNPHFVMSMGKYPDDALPRVEKVCRLLGEQQSTDIEVGRIKGTNIAVVRADPFYTHDSVALHGLLTFVRAAGRCSYMDRESSNNLWDFIEEVMYAGRLDGEQFEDAEDNDTIEGWLSRELEIFRDDSAWYYADYPDGQVYPVFPGIATYRDRYWPGVYRKYSKEEYLGIFGWPSKAIKPVYSYKNWGLLD